MMEGTLNHQGLFTISGTGAIENGWWHQEIKSKIIIQSGITEIGERAFGGCKGVTSVIIPKSVTEIGACAFWGCSSLTSITIPNSVHRIGDYAFAKCTALEIVRFEGKVEDIAETAFQGVDAKIEYADH